MKANELRIGNFVECECEIFQSTSYTPLIIERNEKTISPIPLTAEWLERFRFSQSTDKEHWFINHHGFCLVFDGEDWCLKSRIDEPYVICFTRHVHQLQNLYFSLTGNELTLKQ